MKIRNDIDKVFTVALVGCFIFWILAKIPVAFEFIPFGIIYQAGWLIVAIFAVTCTLYFLYQWIKNKFSFSEIYFYGFLLGIITLLIMRFV